MTTRLPDIEEPIDSLDSILTDHRIAWLQMLNELNDEIISVPEMLEIKAKIITDTKQAIKDLFSQSRGCIDCKKLRCEECERLWQT